MKHIMENVDNHHGVEISTNLRHLNRESLKGIFGTDDLSESDEDPSFDPANEVEDDGRCEFKEKEENIPKLYDKESKK